MGSLVQAQRLTRDALIIKDCRGEKFEDMADEDKDKDEEFLGLHALSSLRMY